MTERVLDEKSYRVPGFLTDSHTVTHTFYVRRNDQLNETLCNKMSTPADYKIWVRFLFENEYLGLGAEAKRFVGGSTRDIHYLCAGSLTTRHSSI